MRVAAVVTIVSLLILPPIAHAATIDVINISQIRAFCVNFCTETVQKTFDTKTDGGIVDVNTEQSASFGDKATTKSFVDISNGIVRASSETVETQSRSSSILLGGSDTLSLNQIDIAETFTVSGSGVVKFQVGITGKVSFDFSPVDTTPNWQVQSALQLFNGGVLLTSDLFLTGFGFPPLNEEAGIFNVDELLIGQINVNDGDIRTLKFSLGMQSSNANALLDFGNTAKISFLADPSVSITFDDPVFLSDLAPVPLPASYYLMIAVGGVFYWCSRARRSRVAV